MAMIMNPPPVFPCTNEGKAKTSDADTDTVSTGESPGSIEKQSSSCSLPLSSEQDLQSPSTPPRRSIFNSYWQKRSPSCSSKDDDSGSNQSHRREIKRSPKFEPSYLGIYSFAPSPTSPKLPPLSLAGSSDLTPSSFRPKSILRRHRSLRVSPTDRPSLGTMGRPRSVSCIGIESDTKSLFGISPPPFAGDSSEESVMLKAPSKGCDLQRQHSFVHFDPTITVHECISEVPRIEGQESNWFSEDELRSFMTETLNLCHCSAVNAAKSYSLPAVKKAYEKAHKAGVKSPVIASTQPEFRALFADPVLHATEEEAVIHDGSKRFFKLATHEMQRVLIVDASPLTLKLFRNHILCMFPMAHVDTAISGKDALDKIEVDSKRRCLNYDVMIVEERLPGRSVTEELTGSELLRLVNKMESSISSGGKPTRQSLKIGVSVSLGEDCESLRNIGGADLFWSKPLPKPSNGLRNQLMNALLTKRGKSVFICGS
ncbi:hypothetical protein ACHAWF_005549 [Thalassiosira exigua]